MPDDFDPVPLPSELAHLWDEIAAVVDRALIERTEDR
jgi:hypothetical protein